MSVVENIRNFFFASTFYFDIILSKPRANQQHSNLYSILNPNEYIRL